MEAVECSLMQLQDRAGPQLERTLTIFHKFSDDLNRKLELANAIFSLAPCYFNGIAQKCRCFSDTMSIFNQRNYFFD